MTDIAIIGFGAAGYAAARAMREAGHQGGIHVFSNRLEPLGPANPMLTTYYTSGKIPFEGMFPFGQLSSICDELGLTPHMGVPVSRLYATERFIETHEGSSLLGPYKSILCASGARSFIPSFFSIPDQSCLYGMRTAEDAYRLRDRVEKGDVRSALVVGASMVGIKVAELLAAAGIRTTIADMAEHIFPLAALPDIAALIENRVRARGIKLLFGSALKTVAKNTGEEDGAYAVTLEGSGGSAEAVTADIVCMCIGTRPNLDYIDPGELDTKSGLVIDDYMQTSKPGIYAAGDCAASKNIQLCQPAVAGLWQNALLQGKTAGFSMAGRSESYSGNIFQNITHFMDMDFISFGSVREPGEVISDGGPGKDFALRAVMHGDKLVCVNILDNVEVSGPIRSYMFKRFLGVSGSIPPQQAGILKRCGLSPGTISRLEGII